MTSNTTSQIEFDNPEVIISELPNNAQMKLEVIQSLLEPCDRTTYGERLREGAKKLDISVRSVQRLFKRYPKMSD